MTIDLGLFYFKETTNFGLVEYVDAGYKFDLHNAHSQIGYLLCYNGMAIYWRSTKKALVATSSNNSEIIAFYEVGESVFS